jgi:hypothetical protein
MRNKGLAETSECGDLETCPVGLNFHALAALPGRSGRTANGAVLVVCRKRHTTKAASSKYPTVIRD